MINSTAEMRRPRSLPRAIRRGLGRLGLRLRAVGLMRGLGKSALISASLAAMAMATDVAFVLPRAARLAIWGTWIATTAVTLLTSVVRPLIRRLAWTDLAALAERGEPSLGERLTTAVGLLRHQPHGSAELIAAVVDDASMRAGQVDLTRAISLRVAFAWLVAGGLAAVSVITPAVVQPDPFAQIGKRFLFPWADIDRVSRFVIELAPGDKVVASGSDVLTSAIVRSRFGEAVAHGEAWLEWTRADGTPNRVRMVDDAEAKQGKRAFTATLPRLSSSLTYRAMIGGDVSPRHNIQVVDWPAVTALKAQIAPPAYTGRPAAPARDSARIDAWEDSQVTLEFEANRRLEQAEVIWPVLGAVAQSPSSAGSSHVVSFKPTADGTHWSATVAAEASGPFTIKLRDEYALENKPEAPRRVVVHADAPPTLAIEAPADLEETGPDDHLLAGIAARDDVAVASAELHATIERGSGSTGPASTIVAAPLDGLGTPVALGEAVLNFATLALKPEDVITYRVRVTDNRPAPRGPNVAWSSAHSLRIVEHSESLRARQEIADREAIRARLEGIKKAVAANRQQTEQLRYQAEIARRGQRGWNETKAKELADREAATREISDQLQLLSRDLEQHPTFHPLARPARQIAEVENQAARSSLDAARRADDPVKRQAAIEQAGVRLNSVTWKVDELKRKFDDLARIDEERRRLNLLAQQEDDLAARADQAAQAGDRSQFDGLADEQERVRRELDEVLKSSPSLRAQALAAHAREASALAARARALAEQEREEARRTADDGARVAAVKALAAQQRALEDDARRLALRVDEPLAQNGRYRIDVNALARSGEAIEQGEIEQARDRAREAESALNRLAREVEDVRRDPKALARRLAQRQEVLRNETVEAIRPSREHPPQTPEGKAALADRLKPLFERQEAIARLATMIPVPQNQEDRARDAVTKTARARDDLRNLNPKDVEGHQNEARDALNRLVESLPDANQRRDRARQKLGEVRSRYEEIARDLEKHLRETAPRSGQSHDPVRAAADLAERIKPLASKERELAEMIGAIDPEPRAFPQRDRAERRALELADTVALSEGSTRPAENAAAELAHAQPSFETLREALPAVQLAAKAAIDRLQQKLDGQTPADDLAAALAGDERNVKEAETKTAPGDAQARTELAANQRRIANALANLEVPDSPLAQAEAIRRAAAAAQALEAPANDKDAAKTRETVARAAEAASTLARRLADEQSPRERIHELATAQRALAGPRAEGDPADHARQEHRIAHELARLPVEKKGEAADLVAAAALLSDQAARLDPGPRPDAAALAMARERAARALERLAAATDRAPATAHHGTAGRNEARAFDDPALGVTPDEEADAAKLAERQRHIREAVQAILGESSRVQQALRAGSTALGREVADLRDRASAISPRSQGPGRAAADALGRVAPETMDRAAAFLQQASPRYALSTQRQAADQAEQAARHIEDLAVGLRADRPPGVSETNPDGLAAAQAAVRSAGQHLAEARAAGQSPADASQAARAAAAAMHQAAQGLRAADQSARGSTKARGRATESNSARGALADQGSPDLDGLKAAVRAKTGRTWGELPGHLRTEILQMSQGQYRDDYARLIELYFREIATDAADRGGRP